jgi:hypothetical protein
MASHGHGKGMRSISTSVPKTVHAELLRRAHLGNWRSLGAYIRAIIDHHVGQNQALVERRTLYPLTDHVTTDAKKTSEAKETHPLTTCCPLAQVVMPLDTGSNQSWTDTGALCSRSH